MLKTPVYFDHRFKGIEDSYKYSPISTIVRKFPSYTNLDSFLSEQVLDLSINDLSSLSNYILKITNDGNWIPKNNLNETRLINKLDDFVKNL